MNTYVKQYWTSELVISSDKDLSDLIDPIDKIIVSVGRISTKFGESETNEDISVDYQFMDTFSLNGDNTCMMKGIAIDNIMALLESNNIHDYYISFGGDIYINSDKKTKINIESANQFNIEVSGKVMIFTSGNNLKRGCHIIGCELGETKTVIINFNEGTDLLNKNYGQLVDTLATKLAANDSEDVECLLHGLPVSSKVTTLSFREGKLQTSVYCASPFFNKEQIEIRDNMIESFQNVFRPDLGKISEDYNSNKSIDTASLVVNANENGIRSSELLVFPNHTDDLGTLFEVGYAIGLSKPIIRYDECTKTYIIVPDIHKSIVSNLFTNKLLFHCNIKSDVILLGLVSASGMDKNNIYYELYGERDNIMLSINFNHVELSNNPAEYGFNLLKKHYDEDDNSSESIGLINGLEFDIVPQDTIDFGFIYDLIDNSLSDRVVTSVS